MERRELFAVASLVVSAALTAIGTFAGDEDDAFWTWLAVVAIAAVAVAVLFWFVVPRVESLGLTALVLAVIGAATIVVFWSGLPVPFAGAAALLGLTARDRRLGAGLGTIALAIAALTVAAAVVLAFTG
jgi:hypothetical protein